MNNNEWKKLYLSEKLIRELWQTLEEIMLSDTYSERTEMGHDFVDQRFELMHKQMCVFRERIK